MLNCADFGVPQRRKRLIVLGKRGKTAPGRPIPTNSKVTVEIAFAGLPVVKNYPTLLTSDEVTLKAADIERRANAKFLYARQLSGIEPIPGDVGYERELRPSVVTSARRTVHTEATVERFAETARGKAEPKSRLFRLSLESAAGTLRAGTGAERGAHTSPRPIHPTEDRVITVREAARLHGYPDWFRFHTTNWHGHRQVGNSVPPPMARAAATVLLDALGVAATKPDRCFLPEDEGLLSLPKSEALSRFETVAAELPRGRKRPSLDEPGPGAIEVA
ncbi:DNA cytosine methyltransferase [Nocardioides sp. B-3]|uniref:DNA cytosine methyltransferase n=1 Tax=Nocardioides sp. B-3 TaxID=2895565 RepID=UPI0021526CEA|nr:DNA cytosine methyltransferase [Nocardioides sp. B-3]